jgi:hypothetical protein
MRQAGPKQLSNNVLVRMDFVKHQVAQAWYFRVCVFFVDNLIFDPSTPQSDLEIVLEQQTIGKCKRYLLGLVMNTLVEK